MDVPSIANWLKNSVPGIVILGAIGSFLAGTIIWAAKRFLAPVVPVFFRQVFMVLAKHFAGHAAKKLALLHLKEGQNRYLAFYTLLVMKFVFSLWVALCSLMLFLYALEQPTDTLLRQAVIAPLVAFFLALWWSFRTLAIAYLPQFFDIEPHVGEAKRKYFESAASKSV